MIGSRKLEITVIWDNQVNWGNWHLDIKNKDNVPLQSRQFGRTKAQVWRMPHAVRR